MLGIYKNCLNHELLSSAEERQLLSAYKYDGDEDARERLILSNMRLAATLAEKYASRQDGVDAEELVAEAVLGLSKAIERFDLSMPYRFSTYAVWWCNHTLSRSDFFNEFVRLPETARAEAQQITKARAAFLQEFGREPTHAVLEVETGIAGERIAAIDFIKTATENVQSIYAPLDGSDGSEDGRTVLDTIPADTFDDIRAMEIREELEWFLSKLDPIERRVVELRHGLTDLHYGERLSWKRIYKELYPDERRRGRRIHYNDLHAFYKGVIAKLRRLARSVSTGIEPQNDADVFAELAGTGETLRLF